MDTDNAELILVKNPKDPNSIPWEVDVNPRKRESAYVWEQIEKGDLERCEEQPKRKAARRGSNNSTEFPAVRG